MITNRPGVIQLTSTRTKTNTDLVSGLRDARTPPHVFTGLVYLLNDDLYMKWIGHSRFDESFAKFVRVVSAPSLFALDPLIRSVNLTHREIKNKVGMDSSSVIENFPAHRQEKSTERCLSILLRAISSYAPIPMSMRIERNRLACVFTLDFPPRVRTYSQTNRFIH